MKKLITTVAVPLLVFQGTACTTKPGETTTIAAVTGSVLGAGLGAIIGSQSGNAGVGALIGGAAGAGTGAVVGNVLENQERELMAQDEVMSDNQRRIDSQRRELESLRRLNSDTPAVDADAGFNRTGSGASAASNDIVVYGGQKPESFARTNPRAYKNQLNGSVAGRFANEDRQPLKAEDLVLPGGGASRNTGAAVVRERQLSLGGVETTEGATTINNSSRGSLGWAGATQIGEAGSSRGAIVSNATQTPKRISADSSSDACKDAEAEMRMADSEPEAREKLFRYRRALRMCPESPEFHNRLGELYMEMNRFHDAEYEFSEAVRLEPNHRAARDNLADLR